MITVVQLMEICPKGNKKNMIGLVPHLNTYMTQYGISTPLRMAHFISQVAHESGGFRYMKEIWGPTPAQKKYEGRKDLGNVHKGDGKKYMGRSPMQLTGYANYLKYSNLLGINLVENPELAETYQWGAAIACAYWNENSLNTLADKDDCKAVTKRINGGYNGLAERQQMLERAKSTFGNTLVQNLMAPVGDKTAEKAEGGDPPIILSRKPVLKRRKVWASLTGTIGGFGTGAIGMFTGFDWVTVLVILAFVSIWIGVFLFLYRNEIRAQLAS